MAAQIPFGWSVRSRRPIDDRYIVADLTARDALDTFRRHEGLFCYVESNDKTYKLVGGITNSDWVEVLDNIGELGVGTPDVDADSLAYFDVTEGEHKKMLLNSLPVNPSQITESGATEGQTLVWNDDTSVWEPGYGRTLVYLVKNQTGGTLLKGKVARAVGTLGASGRILIDYAIADGTHLPKFVMGLIYEDIPNGGDGYVVDFGQIRNVNTNAFNEGDVLWLSPTVAGDLTATKPTAPDYKVLLALVIRKDATNGELQVRVNVGEFLTDLHDVENAGSTGDALVKQASGIYQFEQVKPSNLAQDGAADGEVLTWNNTTSQWEPAAGGGGGGGGDTVTGDETRGIEVTEPTAGNKVVAKKYYNQFVSFTPTITLELKEGRRHIFTATTDFVLANPSNILDFEGRVEIVITQGVGGGHQISSVGDRVIFPNGTIPTLNGTFGESDWLRGTVVNGYLLIYQIESLAAPGIDIEPLEPLPVDASDLIIYAFTQEVQGVNSFGLFEKDDETAAVRSVPLNGNLNENFVYHDLQDVTIEPFGCMKTWKNQVSSDYDYESFVVSVNTNNPKLVASAGRAGIYRANVTNNAIGRASVQSAFASKSKFALIFAASSFESTPFGSRFWFTLEDAAGSRNIEGRITSNGLIYFRIRKDTGDAFTILTSTTKVGEAGGVFIISVKCDFATGVVSLEINGVEEDADTLASTGTFQNLNYRLAFGRLGTTDDQVPHAMHYFRMVDNYTNERITEITNYLINEYRPAGLKEGKDIYSLFDVIISLDRLSFIPYSANVRESTTNTEEVISHDSNGLFDVTAFNAHIGAGDGFATNVRNQVFPVEAFTQTTAARQPKIVTNIFNGRAAYECNNAARRSMQNATFKLDTKALHYYVFVPCNLTTLSALRDDLFGFRDVSPVRMGGGLLNSGGNVRLNMFSQITNAVSLRQSTGTTNLSIGTDYLFTFYYDFENGVIQGYVNGTLEINDTGGGSGTSIGQISLICFGNVGDNSTVAFNGNIAGFFFAQGQLTSAQRIAIETELINTYLPS